MNNTHLAAVEQSTKEKKSANIVRVFFDGKVFQPLEPVDFAPNTSWIFFLAKENLQHAAKNGAHPFELISQLAENLGPADLSENFDRYSGRKIE
ncbi:hypothetical protein HUU05_02835 [candidate division KSB1 bacterium]|nr:hypothetical protein [candidate division KSB1 bacterium]